VKIVRKNIVTDKGLVRKTATDQVGWSVEKPSRWTRGRGMSCGISCGVRTNGALGNKKKLPKVAPGPGAAVPAGPPHNLPPIR
jgi:hypothetical protein